MPRPKLKEQDYLIAFQILYNDFAVVNTCDVYDKNEFPLYSKIPNPEKLLLKKEAFELLSSEAKEIIMDILNSPNEIIAIMITPSRKLLSKKRLRKYLATIWQSKFIADQVIKEITGWVNQL